MLSNANSDTRPKNINQPCAPVVETTTIDKTAGRPADVAVSHGPVKSNLLAEVIFAAMLMLLGGQAMYLALDKIMPIRPEKARSVGVTPQFIQQLEDKKRACLASGAAHCQVTVVIDVIPKNETATVTKTE